MAFMADCIRQHGKEYLSQAFIPLSLLLSCFENFALLHIKLIKLKIKRNKAINQENNYLTAQGMGNEM